MSVEVTARHMDAGSRLQEYARGKGDSLIDAFPWIEHVHVILDVEKRRQIARVVVQAKNHIRAEAEEASENLRTSIDTAVEKIERQMRRHQEKIHDHKSAMRHMEQERQSERAPETDTGTE